MAARITIGGRDVGPTSPPFVIAEMSGNHNQSLERALKIVDAAAAAGAHAVKLQTYTADTITLDVHTDEFLITDKSSLWDGNSLHKLYQLAHTPWEWHAPIMERAKRMGYCASARRSTRVPLISSNHWMCLPTRLRHSKTTICH